MPRQHIKNLDSILKGRDITLSTKVHIVKAMVFPVLKYGWESWTINKTEHQRIDAFELWCWRRLLRVLWTAKRSNQEIKSEYSLEGLMLKLQYFGHLIWGADLLWKASDAEKDCRQEEKGIIEDEMVEWHHQLRGHEFEQSLGVHGVPKSQTQLSNWTTPPPRGPSASYLIFLWLCFLVYKFWTKKYVILRVVWE